jgi:chromosome segregation ATPase
MSRFFEREREEPDPSDDDRDERDVSPVEDRKRARERLQRQVWMEEFETGLPDDPDTALEQVEERVSELKAEISRVKKEARDMVHSHTRADERRHRALLREASRLSLRVARLQGAFGEVGDSESGSGTNPGSLESGQGARSASDEAIRALADVARSLAEAQKSFAEGDRDRLKDMAKLIEALRGVPSSASGENGELREQFEALKKDIDEFKETADKNQRASEKVQEATQSFEEIKKLTEQVTEAVERLKQKEKELEEKAESLARFKATLEVFENRIKILDGAEETEGSIEEARKKAEQDPATWGRILQSRELDRAQLPDYLKKQGKLIEDTEDQLKLIEKLVEGYRKSLTETLGLGADFNAEALRKALAELKEQLQDAQTALTEATIAAQEAQTAFEQARDKVYAHGNEIVEEAETLDVEDEDDEEEVGDDEETGNQEDFEDREPSNEFLEAGEELRYQIKEFILSESGTRDGLQRALKEIEDQLPRGERSADGSFSINISKPEIKALYRFVLSGIEDARVFGLGDAAFPGRDLPQLTENIVEELFEMQDNNEFDNASGGEQYLRQTVLTFCEFIRMQENVADNEADSEVRLVQSGRAERAFTLAGAIRALETTPGAP